MRKTLELFSARKKPSDNTIIDYEFEKREYGWYIKKRVFKAHFDSMTVDEMFIPNELVEQIIMVETAKDELTDSG